MIGKTEILNRLLACKVVTIARTDDPAGLAKAASAIRKGGLDVFEVTMGVPGAVEVLKDLSAQLAPEVLLGAGTVLDAETARAVILAGAQFIVTPAFNPEVVTMANRYGKAVVPGAFTPTEILSAWEAGADMVKVFPARMGGPAYIKDLLAPLPQLRLVPTGGVSLDNAAEYLKAGAAAVGMSALLDKKLIARGDFGQLTEMTLKLRESIDRASA
jgi:2-dehydro-3-deoxyphosphogluconate aldolase/(4S)-4-hydroxy-2-oxoglutarate aldolase